MNREEKKKKIKWELIETAEITAHLGIVVVG